MIFPMISDAEYFHTIQSEQYIQNIYIPSHARISNVCSTIYIYLIRTFNIGIPHFKHAKYMIKSRSTKKKMITSIQNIIQGMDNQTNYIIYIS